MSEDIVQVWETIRTTVEEMGREALAIGPYGLRCYASHRREKYPGSLANDQCEEAISEELANRLCGRPLHGKVMYALPERRYLIKKSRQRCDVVIWLDRANVVRMECKAAYMDDINGDYKAENPLCWRDGKWKDTVAGTPVKGGIKGGIGHDIEKLKNLAALRPRVTEYVGVLLLGFDRSANPIDEQELDRLLPPELQLSPHDGVTPWIAAHRPYEERKGAGITEEDMSPDRAGKGFRQRLWFWYCPVAE